MQKKIPDINDLFNSHTTKLYGMYRQKVIDTNDPNKSGRIKIKVYGYFDELKDEDLPWQEMQTSFIGENYGIINIPQIGSDVWVFFEQGNIYSPVYIQQVSKNYKDKYLPKEYDNIDKKNIDKVYVEQYPNRFNKQQYWQRIIYDTKDIQKLQIKSPYKDNRFYLNIENNTNHKNHIIINYIGNNVKINEISSKSDTTFKLSHGQELSSSHKINIEDNTHFLQFQIIENKINKIEMYYDKDKSQPMINITNDKNVIQMNKDQIQLSYKQQFGEITITNNTVNIGTNSKTIKPMINTDMTLQYKDQLKEVKDKLNELVQQFNSHTHMGTGYLGQPLIILPPSSPVVIIYTKSDGTITTKQW